MSETENDNQNLFEGHGSHWECVGETNETIVFFMEKSVRNGDVLNATQTKDVVVANDRPREDGNTFSLVYPDTDLQALCLLVSDPQEKNNKVMSLFPFARSGTRHRVQIDHIQEWTDGYEARIEGTVGDDEACIGFFDTQYYMNKDRYVVGNAYEFVLAAIAYDVSVWDPEPIIIDDPEEIARHRKTWAAIDPESEADEHEPIRIETKGMAALLPMENWSIGDFSFCGTVKWIRDFDMAGVHVRAMTVTLLRLDDDVDFTVYVCKEALRGEAPKVGDAVQGHLWLQGYLADTKFVEREVQEPRGILQKMKSFVVGQ